MAVTTKSKKTVSRSRSSENISSSSPTKLAFLQNITTGPARIALVVAGLVLITIGIFMVQKKVADDYVKQSATITKAYEAAEPNAIANATTTLNNTEQPTMTPVATSTLKTTPIFTPTPSRVPSSQAGKISDHAASTVNNTYTVKSGDTLWSIAERMYGTGYDWQRIAQANQILAPSSITTGMTLLLPQADKTPQPTVTITAQPSPRPLTYTVTHGDSLWSIAEKVYHDGNQWHKIAEANHLDNPRIIHSGNTFVIP